MNNRLRLILLLPLLLTTVAGFAHEGHGGGKSPPVCLTASNWSVPEPDGPRRAAAPAILADIAKRQVVLLGEQHDSADHHRWQLQTLAALHAQRPMMAIGFEMFPRRVQPALDKWVSGDLTVKQFLEQSEWDKVWNMPADLYLPLFQFARINRIPMLALNVDEKLNKAIVEKGWDAVPEAEREGVGKATAPPEAYRDFLFDVYRQHLTMRGKEGVKAAKSDREFRNFVESQTTWDRAMAELLARATSGASKPLVVGVMGSGHIRHGHGVPHQLRALGIKDIGTLLPVELDDDCGEIRPGFADAVFALPNNAVVKPDPPRLGVLLEEKDGGVRIAEVTSGSLAERTGLKAGDRIQEVAGTPAKKVAPVIAAVRVQPAGTWLPIRIARGDDTLDMVVKFPLKP
jgi:uncharacterized iron-regulated protein